MSGTTMSAASAGGGGSGRSRGGGSCPGLIAAQVARDLLAAVDDPDGVAVGAQLDALMDERLRRAVEAAPEAQGAVERDAARARVGVVEALRRQGPQRSALLGQPLGDD